MRFLLAGALLMLSTLAHAGTVNLYAAGSLKAALTEVAKAFEAHSSAKVRVEARGFEIYDVEPKALPDVLAERPVIVHGKWRGERAGTIRVSGIGGRGAWLRPTHGAHYRVSIVIPGAREFGFMRSAWDFACGAA